MVSNLFQLIHSHDAGLVVQRIMELYKDRIGTENQYLTMYRKLCTLESANSARDFIQGMRILVHDIPPDEFNRVGYVCVSGVNGKSKRESWIANHSDLPLLHPEDSSWDQLEHYALSFCPWNEWLILPLDEACFAHFSKLDVLSHILWEMSFYGFEEALIQGQLKEIRDVIARIDNGTEQTYSMKEVKARMAKRFSSMNELRNCRDRCDD